MSKFNTNAQFSFASNLMMAGSHALEQLNLISGKGDFEIYETTPNEIVLKNNASCATFCVKQENCDVSFCDQRCKEIQRGIHFIDNTINMSILSCANLGDSVCEVRLTISF